jgi:hypothetical protein
MKFGTPVAALILMLSLQGRSEAQDSSATIRIAANPGGWRLEADAPPKTLRAVWEVSPSLVTPSWSVMAVQSISEGRAGWTNVVGAPPDTAFFRIRTYDTPGFNAQLDRLIVKVREAYPEATLLESSPLLTSTVSELPDGVGLRAVLHVAKGTVVAQQSDPLADPQIDFNPAPWLGDMLLPWPVEMNLEEAESLLRNAGFASEYKTLTLRRPVYPGMIEPYFIFGTPRFGFVFVGTSTKKVFRGN